MDPSHINILVSNLSTLTQNTDLSRLLPKLISNKVFTPPMIDRILSADRNRQEHSNILIYLAVQKRGPRAFKNLVNALLESGHPDLATMLLNAEQQSRVAAAERSHGNNLAPMDTKNAAACQQTDFPPSSSASSSVAPYQPSAFPPSPPAEDAPDSTPHTCRIPQNTNHSTVPFQLPGYIHSDFKKLHMGDPPHGRYDVINMSEQGVVHRRVKVIPALEMVEPDGKLPEKYRMVSYPRGYALIINNICFQDLQDLSVRNGAQNDSRDMAEMFRQLYFEVEVHHNKTKMEMVDIVETFSQKPEFRKIDCVWVVLMSHGKEGESEEDTEILGIDGIGFKTRDVISYFHNDCCPRLHQKPKIFIFQSCRGVLKDLGVVVDPFDDTPAARFHRRTETDGKKVHHPHKDRSRSDIFVAFPVPPGIKANRDVLTGAWFIQTIVDVICKYSNSCDLDDIFKIVDNDIKRLVPYGEANFQTVTTRSIGFNKKLYLNPGLYYKDNRLFRQDDGTDVVDTPSDDQSDYSKRGDLVHLTADDEDGKAGCFNCYRCNTS